MVKQGRKTANRGGLWWHYGGLKTAVFELTNGGMVGVVPIYSCMRDLYVGRGYIQDC